MKSVIFILLLLGGLAGSATAQKREQFIELPGFSGPSPLLVEELTRQMSSSLHLDEAQYVRLRSANEAKLARLTKSVGNTREKPSNAPKSRSWKLSTKWNAAAS